MCLNFFEYRFEWNNKTCAIYTRRSIKNPGACTNARNTTCNATNVEILADVYISRAPNEHLLRSCSHKFIAITLQTIDLWNMKEFLPKRWWKFKISCSLHCETTNNRARAFLQAHWKSFVYGFRTDNRRITAITMYKHARSMLVRYSQYVQTKIKCFKL